MFKLPRREKLPTSKELKAQSEVLLGERNARITDLKTRLQRLLTTIESVEHTGADFDIAEISNIRAEIQQLERKNDSVESKLESELLELSEIEDEIARLEAAAGHSDGTLYNEELKKAEEMAEDLADKETLESLREKLYSGLYTNPKDYDAAIKEYLYSYYGMGSEEGLYWSLPSVILSLCGDDSERAWTIREEILSVPNNLISDVITIPTIISILGIDTPRAQELRQHILKLYKEDKLSKIQHSYHTFYMGVAGALILSTIGLDSPEAQSLRDSLRNKAGAAVYILGHTGLDTAAAWTMREELLDEEPNAVILSLLGLKSVRAREMRNYNRAFYVIESTTGLDGIEEWKIREEALRQRENMSYYWTKVLESLAGVDSDKAWSVRDRYMVKIKKHRLPDEKRTLFALLKSLDGLSSPRALEMKMKLINFIEEIYPDNPDSQIAANIKSFELILSQLAQAKRAW